MKQCPECMNQVVDAAIACKYCGHIFDDQSEKQPVSPIWKQEKQSEIPPKTNKKKTNLLIPAIFIGISLICVLLAYGRKDKSNQIIAPTNTKAITFDIPATLTYLVLPTEAPMLDTRTNYEKCAESNYTVIYLLHGSALYAGITWQNQTNGIEQGEWDIPFCYAYNNFKSGDFVYISAQIASDSGDVTCEILHNNEVIAKAHADGFPNIATCSGAIP